MKRLLLTLLLVLCSLTSYAEEDDKSVLIIDCIDEVEIQYTTDGKIDAGLTFEQIDEMKEECVIEHELDK